MPSLFDHRDRDDGHPATYGEDSFTFLSRVAGPFWERARNELDGWYEAFPDHDGDLRRRFRDRAPDQHYAAWWELYLHRAFSCLGFNVEVHPKLEASSGRPDFLLSRDDDSFLLEAATVFSGIVEEGRHGGREAQVLDAINSIESTSFHLGVNFEQIGSSTLRRIAITSPISAWLSGFDPDAVRTQIDLGGSPPEKLFEIRDWALNVFASPVNPEHRGADDHRLIGFGPVSAGSVNDREKIGAALRRKRSRYGEPDRPLVIALLSLSSFLEDRDIEQILFGSLAVSLGPGATPARTVRRSDGLWTERQGQPGRRIAGVLVGVNLLHHNCGRLWPRFWTNPWAKYPLKIELPFPAPDEPHKTSRAPSEILGLPNDWPGPEPPFPR